MIRIAAWLVAFSTLSLRMPARFWQLLARTRFEFRALPARLLYRPCFRPLWLPWLYRQADRQRRADAVLQQQLQRVTDAPQRWVTDAYLQEAWEVIARTRRRYPWTQGAFAVAGANRSGLTSVGPTGDYATDLALGYIQTKSPAPTQQILTAPAPNGTDDTSAIKNLIAGGNVWLNLLPGAYLVTSLLDVASNTTIQGAGIDATTLRIKSGSFNGFGFGYILQCSNQIPTNANCHVRDLTLDGNMRSGTGSANQGGLCLPGNWWTLERLRFYDSSYFKLFLGSITNPRVKNCRFDGVSRGTDTIGGGGNSDALIEGCFFDSTNDGNLLDFYGADTGLVYRNNFSTLTNTFFLEGSTDALIEGNYLVGGISVLSTSRLNPTSNINPKNIRIVNNELNLNGLAGSSGIQVRYDDYAGATTHVAGGGNVIANNIIRNPAKVGILIFGQADAWKSQGDVVTSNKIVNPNSDGTNTINTGFQTFNNTGLAIGIGVADVIVGNSVIDDRGGGALMQYGYAFGGSAATTLTLTMLALNTSVGHTINPVITQAAYTPNGLDTTSLGAGIALVTTAGQLETLRLTDLGGNGATLHFLGGAGGKYLRTHPGTNDLEVLDSAHNNVIYKLSDVGAMSVSGHIISTATGAPTTSNLGANVTSVTPAGNDVRGELTIVMSAGLAANTRVCTVTFAASYGATPPKVILVDQTSTAGLAIVNSYVLATSTGVSFDLAFDQALVAGTYKIDYIVIG